MNKNARIAIVGGGAAGISAALFLQRAGFGRVTVFEASPEVGGKVSSVKVDGQVHELGAVVMTEGYPQTMALAREFGCELISAPREWVIDPSTGVRRPLGTLNAGDYDGPEAKEIEQAVFAWTKALRKNRKHVGRAGYHSIPPELAQPFSDWARAHGAERLKDFFVIPLTCFGYGSLDDIPTAYVMKNMTRKSFLRVPDTNRDWWTLAEGYQSLIRYMATELADLRLGCRVTRVTRGYGVTVESIRKGKRRSDIFDQLILAVPLQTPGGLKFMDLCQQELRLFSEVKTYRYATTLCRATGFEGRRAYACILRGDDIIDPPPGEPSLFMQHHADSDVTTFYTQATDDMDEAAVEARVRALVERVGGEVTEMITTRIWRYFPHVGSEEMAGGWFEQVEALQGHKHTYYAGAQLDFEIVEGAVSYSRGLVDRFFDIEDAR